MHELQKRALLSYRQVLSISVSWAALQKSPSFLTPINQRLTNEDWKKGQKGQKQKKEK
jgi:hypothetical protein